MKWYRLMDCWWEPYYTGYNDTDLKELAYSIFSLWDSDDARADEQYYWKTEEEAVNKIYEMLLAWERDFLFMVEESDEPFEAEGDYGWDDCWHNYSREDILKYASTREDLKEYDEDALVEYVWSFSTHNWLTNRHLSEIVDDFTYLNWKDGLFGYLNNLLFTTHTQVMDTARERFNNELWITIDEDDLAYYVSQFIDQKELYDLDYNE